MNRLVSMTLLMCLLARIALAQPWTSTHTHVDQLPDRQQHRLSALHVQCRFWAGTISAALYLPFLHGTHVHSDGGEQVQEYSTQVLGTATDQAAIEEKLRLWYHRHMEAQELPCRLDINVYVEHIRDLSEWSTYPNNAMRNRALALANTEMVLPLDSDFIPGPLHWNAALVHDADVYAHHWSTVANGSNVLVLNAIDTNKSLPTLYDHHTWARLVLQYGSKSNLTAWIVEGHVEQFQAFGHAETNWTRWQGADNPYAVEYLTFDGVWPSEYEPYFLAKRDALPWYDERFRGYYNNKMSFCWTIKMLGTGFVVHPSAFLLHYAHQRGYSVFAPSERNKAMTTKLYWHNNPDRVRKGCGVSLPFVADVSPDCAASGVVPDTTACRAFFVSISND